MCGRPVPVEQLDISTGEVIKVFPNMARAAKEVNVTREAIRVAVRGPVQQTAGFWWRKAGDTTLPHTAYDPAIAQICLDTGEVLQTFESVRLAAAALNISESGIYYVLCGKSEKVRGFSFRRVADPRGNGRPRPVQQICRDTGKVLATFPSPAAAARALNVNNNSIWKAAKGRTNNFQSFGYVWRFVGEEDEKI